MEPLPIVGDVALLRIACGKANAMSVALLETLNRLLDRLEQSPATAAVITGYERYFSAGLALPTLIALDRPQMKSFIETFNATMMRIFTCARPVVAAINGHAIAGGCVLALQADYRIMAAGDGKVGLNEVRLGIGLPAAVLDILRTQVPAASILPIAMEGLLFSPDRALALGLIHEVVPIAELEERALARAGQLGAVPPSGFSRVKAALRDPIVERAQRTAMQDVERLLDDWFSDAGRARLTEAAARLSH